MKRKKLEKERMLFLIIFRLVLGGVIELKKKKKISFVFIFVKNFLCDIRYDFLGFNLERYKIKIDYF